MNLGPEVPSVYNNHKTNVTCDMILLCWFFHVSHALIGTPVRGLITNRIQYPGDSSYGDENIASPGGYWTFLNYYYYVKLYSNSMNSIQSYVHTLKVRRL